MLGKIFQIFNTRWDHIFLFLFFWSDLQSYSNTLAGQSLDAKQVCLHLVVGARCSVDYLVSGVQIVLLLLFYIPLMEETDGGRAQELISLWQALFWELVM